MKPRDKLHEKPPDDGRTEFLVRQAQSGSESPAWAGLSAKIDARLRAKYHNRPLPMGHDVSDFVMVVLAKVVVAIGTYVPDGPGSFWKWLHTIEENMRIDLLRRERAIRRGGGQHVLGTGGEDDPLERAADSREPSPTKVAYLRELEQAEQECADCLSEHARTVYMMRRRQGLSYEEIAQILHQKAPSLRKTFERARGQVWECLCERVDSLGERMQDWRHD